MTTAIGAGTRRESSAPEVGSGTGTLAGEHSLLLRGVRRRAASVSALIETRSWPHAELCTLTGFLRTAVLRQVADEEALLYPHGASAPVAELTADHVRLQTLTEELDQAAPTRGPVAPLRELIDELLRVLERHLVQEQAVFAALPEAPDPSPRFGRLTDGAWHPAHIGSEGVNPR